MDHLKVSGFHRRIPYLVAEHEGFFANEGLDAAFHTVTYAPDHCKEMAEGRWDLTLSSADNMIARTTLDGTDYVLFVQAEEGLSASIFGRRGMTTLDDLRGKLIASDNGTNLDMIRAKILRNHGITEADYRTESIGSSPIRLDAFLKGRVDGAILTSPWSDRALGAGAALLARAEDHVPHWPLVCGWALRGWVESNRELVVRFVRALAQAADWALDPDHREGAITLLMEAQGVSRERAEFAHSRIVPKVRVNPAAIQTVIDLRAEMGVYPPPLSPPERFYDLSYWRQATGLGAP